MHIIQRISSIFVKYRNIVRDLLLYGGLEKGQFLTIRSKARPENQMILRYATVIAVIAFAVLSIFSHGLVGKNRLCYVIFAVVMLGLLLIERFIGFARRTWLYPMIVIFKYIVYAFALVVSLLHQEYPAVTVFVFLVLLPVIFIFRPIYLFIDTFVVALTFCILTSSLKTPELASADIWNAVTFSCLGLLIDTLMMKIRFQSLYRETKILYMSETDLLTGVRNRNAYEEALPAYSDKCSYSLLCIYADVNGLHELNNTQGHEAGDRMLQFISREMKKRFSAGNTFRTGGDEFVILQPDVSLMDGIDSIKEMEERFDAKGYHVSFGAACQKKEELQIRDLIRHAENEMYLAKRRFYSQSAYDRRRQ